MSYDHAEFRRFLQTELLRRCRKNPKYSLRAFAKTLQVYHATLSALLAGRRPFSAQTVRKLSAKLGLDSQLTDKFLNEKSSEQEDYRILTLDIFLATSEWYHDAILELTHVKGFKPRHEWIARRLGLTSDEVSLAVERLVRLELLQILPGGKWLDISRDSTTITDNDFTMTALKKYQEKILELSIVSLQEVDPALRDHTSMAVAIQTQDIKKVKDKIKKFRRSLTKYLQRGGVSQNEVYQMAFSFFPLSKPKDNL